MSVPAAVREIQDAIARGNYGRAELLCRHTMASRPDFPWAPLLLARTALEIGEIDASRHWRQETAVKLAGHSSDAFPEIQAELANLNAELDSAVQERKPGGYLLIKSWGYGFWSDIEHVIGALLLAEMTNRTPVVHWAGNSYFTDDPSHDAFRTFYEPISSVSIESIIAEGRDVYPRRWTNENLLDAPRNVWEEEEKSRFSGLYLLNRDERTVVSDYFTQVLELLPWLDPNHWLYGADAMDAIRMLYYKYFVLQPDIQAEIDTFVGEYISGRSTFAVHVRNLDKGLEDPSIVHDNASMLEVLDAQLAAHPDQRLYLMTDSAEIVDEYTARYGDRVFNTDCARTDGIVPLTWKDSDTRRRLGVEVIKDTHIAAACDGFIGFGGSNVACMVACLKDWPAGACRLFGDNVKTRRNWLLHDW